MGYFPFFIDIRDKKVLVVGGGKVATRKVEKLLPFTNNITVVAPKVTETIKRLAKEGKITLKKRRFLVSDLKDAFAVIVAVDSLALQRRIFKLCEKRGILCNSVDSPDYCNFIFPSLVVRGDLVIGISTGGRVPALSKRVREIIESCLPENVDRILEEVARLRESLKKGEKRQELIKRIVEERL